ncbi:Cytochrome c oxidase subunit 2 [bacterium HR17]|uniref:Cytochrome c oxidase subunit 2 n=1 Tax=Candidatus Fervidibacter japonicus TaxID=2035412 RepID=A0A2H5XF72_9BACT|nr:Cytochrome c oxidase subunit 2 [bacterium HR17]
MRMTAMGLALSLAVCVSACRHQETQPSERPTVSKRSPTRNNPIVARSSPSGLVERGKTVYDETGCATCHAIGGIGGTIGPSLDGVGKKYDAAKLRRILLNPQTLNPNTTMPAFEGSEEDLNALVAYLQSLK